VPSHLLVLDPREPGLAAIRPWIAFQLAFALEPQRAAEVLRRCDDDPVAALRHARPRARPRPEAVERALRALRRVGASLLPLPSPAYPWRLAQIADPAPVLSVIGDFEALSAPSVGLVGARAATAYGLAMARELGFALAGAGLVVVSGLARGIDAAAHEGALAAGGRTIAVQACGPDRVYPARHRDLAERIARSGAVLCELPPGARPLRAHFPLRNRLISGLSRALIVVEARERSGSLITAHHALAQGADVFAVPGPVNAPTSRGSNRLLRDGAWPLLEAADVLDVLGLPASPVAQDRPGPSPPPSGSDALAIVAALERAPASRDELGRALGHSPDRLALALLDLEIEGRIVRDRDGRFRVVS
jgi:DNA processing protein